MLKLYKLRDYNFRLVILLVITTVIGVMLVNSADSSLRNKQIFGMFLGLFVMVVVSLIDYSWIMRFYTIIYLVNLVMLIIVIIFGVATNGAARWVNIGGFQFQPTELSKIMVIVFLSAYFMRHETDLSEWKTIFRSIIVIAVPLVLILRQPDLKNTITLSVIFTLLYFAAGLSYRKIGIILAIVVPLVLGIFLLITQTDLKIVDDYQKTRIMDFINAEDDDYSQSSMQQDNSIMAIGSGRLTGKGLNNNQVSSANKGNFVAEIQNDFIFAVAGEELGFVGCVAILILLFLIVLECIRTGQKARNLSGKLVCTGIGSLVAVQSFINICVATGLMPNTGTTLPFVSYGLTSLVSLYIGMGFVLNVSLQKRTDNGGILLSEEEIQKLKA
ncbi:MAG: FtsW/RodA/SpoVE family cell cycle protein [Eubacterium sp.]|nr:FtsW/RodA/SpoVE family cell cycle protein [Eubacterium sp.]